MRHSHTAGDSPERYVKLRLAPLSALAPGAIPATTGIIDASFEKGMKAVNILFPTGTTLGSM